MRRAILSGLAVVVHLAMRVTLRLVQRGGDGGSSMQVPAGSAGHAGSDRSPQGQQQSQQHQEPDAKDLHFFMLSRALSPVS